MPSSPSRCGLGSPSSPRPRTSWVMRSSSDCIPTGERARPRLFDRSARRRARCLCPGRGRSPGRFPCRRAEWLPRAHGRHRNHRRRSRLPRARHRRPADRVRRRAPATTWNGHRGRRDRRRSRPQRRRAAGGSHPLPKPATSAARGRRAEPTTPSIAFIAPFDSLLWRIRAGVRVGNAEKWYSFEYVSATNSTPLLRAKRRWGDYATHAESAGSATTLGRHARMPRRLAGRTAFHLARVRARRAVSTAPMQATPSAQVPAHRNEVQRSTRIEWALAPGTSDSEAVTARSLASAGDGRQQSMRRWPSPTLTACAVTSPSYWGKRGTCSCICGRRRSSRA